MSRNYNRKSQEAEYIVCFRVYPPVAFLLISLLWWFAFWAKCCWWLFCPFSYILVMETTVIISVISFSECKMSLNIALRPIHISTLYTYDYDIGGRNWSFLGHVMVFFQLRTLLSHGQGCMRSRNFWSRSFWKVIYDRDQKFEKWSRSILRSIFSSQIT